MPKVVQGHDDGNVVFGELGQGSVEADEDLFIVFRTAIYIKRKQLEVEW
jgi:hypothetical protein